MIDEDGRPHGLVWEYDRAEVVLDGAVHVAGLALGIVGVTVLIVLALRSPVLGQLPVAVIYAAGLLAMLGFSAAYNLWPLSRVKWMLRRFDHSAIYLLIAATSTPFAAIGIASIEMPVWRGASASVRTSPMPQSAKRAYDDHTFWPVTT